VAATGQAGDIRRSGAKPEASPLGRFSWALFDWANQPYFTLITTFIFAPYFAVTVVGDPVRGQALWGYTQSAAGVTIALLAPVLGAVADAGGARKPWIAAFALLCAVASAGLWLALPAAPPGLLLAVMALVVLGSLGAEFSFVFYNAMLPDLVPPGRVGGLSGLGWGCGYLGGLVSLAIVLVGFSLPDETWFTLDKASHAHDRMVGPLTGAWFLLFMLPLFAFTPDRPRTGKPTAAIVRDGLRELRQSLAVLRRFDNMARYLIARMIYYDGLSAVFAIGGIYAAGLFGWTSTALGVFGIVIIVFAALGAFVGGWLDDRIGSKRTILVMLGGLILASLGVASMGDGEALFVLSVSMPEPDGGLLASPAERIFLVWGCIIGFCGGPIQAASRTMVTRLAPPEMIGAFFGLYALSGKATAFLAPFLIGVLTTAMATQRAAMIVVLAFLLVGTVLLLAVREERAPDSGDAS
jgi:UMF1 family MFS transporter